MECKDIPPIKETYCYSIKDFEFNFGSNLSGKIATSREEKVKLAKSRNFVLSGNAKEYNNQAREYFMFIRKNFIWLK